MTRKLPWKQERFFYLIGGILVLLLCLYFKYRIDKNKDLIKETDLSIIEGLVLIQRPVWKKSRSHDYIEFHFQNYPQAFQISEFDYPCSVGKKMIEDFYAEDTVSIAIDAPTYNELLNNTYNHEIILIHSLVLNNLEYCDLDCRNYLAVKDSKFGMYLSLIISPLLIIAGLFKNEPKIGKFKINLQVFFLVILIVTVVLVFFFL